jgi:hypothetical protein
LLFAGKLHMILGRHLHLLILHLLYFEFWGYLLDIALVYIKLASATCAEFLLNLLNFICAMVLLVLIFVFENCRIGYLRVLL